MSFYKAINKRCAELLSLTPMHQEGSLRLFASLREALCFFLKVFAEQTSVVEPFASANSPRCGKLPLQGLIDI